MTNYTIIDNNIIASNISNSALRVYLLLLSMCFNKDYCFPSQSYIAQKLHISVRTVQRAIKELVQAKLIKVKRRGSVSNIYYMLNKVVSNGVNSLKKTVNKAKNSIKNNIRDKTGKFHNFKQRNYNFKNLEDMLLGNKKYNAEELLLE